MEPSERNLLSQQFRILSGVVPGLEMIDETSILGETINYMKNLQERVDMLEEKLSMQTHVEEQEEEVSSVDKNSGSSSFSHDKQQPTLPEVKVKICNKQALLKIHCNKKKQIMTKILSQMEKLNLTVVRMNASPFGNLAIDITMTVEMDKESTLMANEIVQALHSALGNPA